MKKKIILMSAYRLLKSILPLAPMKKETRGER